MARVKKHADLAPYPASFQRSIKRLRTRAAKVDHWRESQKIKDAGYRAYEKARGEADPGLWDSMCDIVEELGRKASASAEVAVEERQKQRYEEIARLTRLEREQKSQHWSRLNPSTAAAKRRCMK